MFSFLYYLFNYFINLQIYHLLKSIFYLLSMLCGVHCTLLSFKVQKAYFEGNILATRMSYTIFVYGQLGP